MSAGAASSGAAAASAPVAPPRGRGLEGQLGNNDHLAMYLCLFLTGKEVCMLGAASAYWRGLLLSTTKGGSSSTTSAFLWKSLAERDTEPCVLADLTARLEQHQHGGPLAPSRGAGEEAEVRGARAAADCGLLKEAYGLASSMAACQRVRWSPAVQLERAAGLRPMEGHAAALVGGRWACIVGGFGRGIKNELWVSDSLQWDRDHKEQALYRHGRSWTVLPILPDASAPPMLAAAAAPPPPLVYGHGAVAVGPASLLVFGGVRYGGYQGDVNTCYLLRLSPSPPSSSLGLPASVDEDPRREQEAAAAASGLRPPVLAYRRRVVPPPGGVQPTSRAYCSLTLACGRVWVLGGIHAGRACNVLEALDLHSMTWSSQEQLAATGQPPSRRMGHSAVWVPWDHSHQGGSSRAEEEEHGQAAAAAAECGGRLVVAGGSDGSDLLRNGRELADVHVLTITRARQAHSSSSSSSSSSSPRQAAASWSWSWRLAWSTPLLQHPPPVGALGRTHTAHLIGKDRILYFGGSARLSNGLCTLHLPQQQQRGQQGEGSWHRPARQYGPPPLRRLSHVSLLAGRLLWVHGGWHGAELGDACLLDLAPHSLAAAAAEEEGRGQHQDDDDDHEEEDGQQQEEAEDNGDDDDGFWVVEAQDDDDDDDDSWW